jgi:hypothetical protein
MGMIYEFSTVDNTILRQDPAGIIEKVVIARMETLEETPSKYLGIAAQDLYKWFESMATFDPSERELDILIDEITEKAKSQKFIIDFESVQLEIELARILRGLSDLERLILLSSLLDVIFTFNRKSLSRIVFPLINILAYFNFLISSDDLCVILSGIFYDKDILESIKTLTNIKSKDYIGVLHDKMRHATVIGVSNKYVCNFILLIGDALEKQNILNHHNQRQQQAVEF